MSLSIYSSNISHDLCIDYGNYSDNNSFMISISDRYFQRFFDIKNIEKYRNNEINKLYITEDIILDKENEMLIVKSKDQKITLNIYVSIDDIKKLLSEIENVFVFNVNSY